MIIVYIISGNYAAMAVKIQKTVKKWMSCGWVVCILPIAGCLGSGTNYLQDVGVAEPLPAPLAAEPSPTVNDDQAVQVPSNKPSSTEEELYADLPTGPDNTGTYPDLRAEPAVRIDSKPGEDVEALTQQMIALADEHKAGRISTAAYNRRLKYLKNLAKNHSTDMLAQIGEPAN